MKKVMVSALAVLVWLVVTPKAEAQIPSAISPSVTQVASSPPGAAPALAPPSPSITGTVKQYLLTPVGDVEGVELQDGTDVRFAPHLGAELATIVKPGDRVSVMGFVAPPTACGRAIKALTITNVVTSQSVVDQPPTAPPPPPWLRCANMREMRLSGTLEHCILNDRGDIDGLILNNGDEVKFPPHVGTAVAMALGRQPSATIQARGYGTVNGFGTVLDAMTGSLSVGGQPIPIANYPGPPPP